MKRRSFLQFFGLASAAPLAVKAAAKVEEVAKALPIEPTVPVYETVHGEADTCCTVSTGCSVNMTYIRGLHISGK